MMSSRQDVSGNYAGGVTRMLAHWVDISVAGFLFVAGSAAVDYVVGTIAGVETVSDNTGWWHAAAAALWTFLYWWVSIALAGKTIGKALLGLRVLSREGEILSVPRSAVRALALPISYALLGLGFLGILVGKERRALHDVFAGSAVVYDWGPRTAELPSPISAFLARRSVDSDLPETEDAAIPDQSDG